MEHANHMQEIFHPCPPDEKSESEANFVDCVISHSCFAVMFCDVVFDVAFI